MKTLALLAQLQPAEEELLRAQLKAHKRKKLYRLYICLSEEPDLTREELFERLFETAYHCKKDYKLRNELRLLNQEIEALWIEEERQNQLRSDDFRQQRAYFKLLLDREAFDLLNREWKRALQQAQEAQHFEQLGFLWELRFGLDFRTREVKAALFEDSKQSLQQARQYRYWQGVEGYLINRGRQAYVLANQHAITHQSKEQLPELPFEEELLEQHFLFEYLECIAQSYLAEGKEKLAYLERCLALQSDVEAIRPRFAANALPAWASMAVEYSVQRQFEKSHQAFQKVIPPWEALTARHLPIVYNYLVNLLYLEKWQEAQACVEAVWEILPPDHRLYARFCYMRCWLCLFQEEHEAGLDLLITDALQRHADFDNYYARLLFALLYFQMDDWESCERELTNMRQRLRYKKKEINPLFECYAQALSELHKRHIKPQTAQESAAWGRRIRKDLQEALAQEQGADLLFRKWIFQYLEQPKAQAS